MRRREFIRLLSGAAAAWPLALRAQQQPRIRVIGVLWPGATPPASPRMESFRQGLREAGMIEGRDFLIELRYAQNGFQQLPEFVAELVRMKVDVISPAGDFAASACTRSGPLPFCRFDPLRFPKKKFAGEVSLSRREVGHRHDHHRHDSL